ncbi:MAG: hypothetical protein ABS81_08755 [Pseudonocardia sp. SCN 72-86]|nr:MAG: hypothetical protein ABS81_08755 [Pseudonocardia sp. SCN 72-86]
MTTKALAAALLRDATRELHDDPATAQALRDCTIRLDRPLRVALTGTLKSGKSTLLNALVGAEVAASDTTECTQDVAWYRADATSAARVRWTLVDTPGTASNSVEISVLTREFLAPDAGGCPVDVVVHLMRSLHETDLDLLRLVHARAGAGRPLGVVGVLSRADEAAEPGTAPLAAARRTAVQLRADLRPAGLVTDVVATSGLLALRGRTSPDADLDLVVALAGLPDAVRDAALVSPERLRAAPDPVPPGAARLLDTFGMVGLRVAVDVIRRDPLDGRAPATALVAASGVDRLRRLVDARFAGRHAELTARAVLLDLAALLRAQGRGTGPTARRVATQLADTHVLTELRAIGRIAGLDLPEPAREGLLRTLGGLGTAAHVRLGLTRDATAEQLRDAALDGLRHWRRRVDDPLLDPAARAVLRAAARSCEAVLAGADDPAAPRPHRVTGREIAAMA